MADPLTACLRAAQSADPSARKAAEQQLAGWEAAGAAPFLGQLVVHLADEGRPPDTRRLAGLLLKNAVSAEGEGQRAEKAARWRGLDAPTQAAVRAALLATLSSPVKEARSTAAQVVGKLGALDLASSAWPELVPGLQGLVAGPAAGGKQAALSALGYVCEGLDAAALPQASVNTVLTAVVAGLRPGEEGATRVVAARALANALAFARKNFETEAERNYLMQVREACMECLADVADLYCGFLAAYAEAVFGLTRRAFSEGAPSEPVALKALDFWANVADREAEAAEDEEDAAAAAALPGAATQGIAARVAPSLVPLLLQALPSRAPEPAAGGGGGGGGDGGGDDEDEDEWSLSQASGMCLQALARAVGDPVLELVMPFVQAHVASPDWRLREAAVTAFGTLIEGPSEAKLVPTAAAALPALLGLLAKDPARAVRRAAAWCLGVVFEGLHRPGDAGSPQVLPPAALHPALTALLDALTKDDLAVADSAIYALDRLAQGYAGCADAAATPEPGGAGAQPPAAGTPLSPYFSGLVHALLQVARRPDASKLCGDAYEAVCDTLGCATAAEAPFLAAALLPHLLGLLAATWDGGHPALPPPGAPGAAEAAEARAELQGYLCCALTVAVTKLAKLAPEALRAPLSPAPAGGNLLAPPAAAPAAAPAGAAAAAPPASDALMAAYLRVLGGRPGWVHGEALAAVAALTEPLGGAFAPYLPPLLPFLQLALSPGAASDAATCASAVGLVGDLARALGPGLLPWADPLMLALLTALSSPELAASVKPHIVSAFGDVALALGPAFERFLPHVAAMLGGAAAHAVAAGREAAAQGDGDRLAAVNELRAAVLEAYSAVVQAFAGEENRAAAERLLLPQARAVAEFVAACAADGGAADDGVLRAAAGALGDLATLPGCAGWLAGSPGLMRLLHVASASHDPSVREAAAFAHGALQQAQQQAAAAAGGR